MSGTTPFLGVRVFSDLSSTFARINTRDSTAIGLACPRRRPTTHAFRSANSPAFRATIAELGAGIAEDPVNQIASEGVVTGIQFYRAQHSEEVDPQDSLEAEINAIAGPAGTKTGALNRSAIPPALIS